MVLLYMVTFTIHIPQMLAYIPYMDPKFSGWKPWNPDFFRVNSEIPTVFFCPGEVRWRWRPRCLSPRKLTGPSSATTAEGEFVWWRTGVCNPSVMIVYIYMYVYIYTRIYIHINVYIYILYAYCIYLQGGCKILFSQFLTSYKMMYNIV